MCEALIGKKKWLQKNSHMKNNQFEEFEPYFENVEGFEIDDVISSINLYKKYQHEDGMLKLKRNRPEIWKIFDDEILETERQFFNTNNLAFSLTYKFYRSWFIDYCFRDVI